MEFGEPPLARYKTHLVALGSLFAAYCFYWGAVNVLAWAMTWVLAFALVGFALFGFLQGFLPILNFIGFPIFTLLVGTFGTLGYWLGAVSLLIFILTQFKHVRRA